MVPSAPKAKDGAEAAAPKAGGVEAAPPKSPAPEVDAVEPPPKEGKPVGAAPKLVLGVVAPNPPNMMAPCALRRRAKESAGSLICLPCSSFFGF